MKKPKKLLFRITGGKWHVLGVMNDSPCTCGRFFHSSINTRGQLELGVKGQKTKIAELMFGDLDHIQSQGQLCQICAKGDSSPLKKCIGDHVVDESNYDQFDLGLALTPKPETLGITISRHTGICPVCGIHATAIIRFQQADGHVEICPDCIDVISTTDIPEGYSYTVKRDGL